MKNSVIKIISFLIPLIIVSLITKLTIPLRESEIIFSKGVGVFVIFLLISFSSYVLYKVFSNKINPIFLSMSMLIGTSYSVLPKALAASAKFSIKIAPYYLILIFAVFFGYLYFKRKKNKYLLITALIPLVFSLGIYDLWVHKIEYGNWTGETKETSIANFSFINQNKNKVTNESLYGKTVLLDFWFINCLPCWKKFPKLQKLYDRYKNNPNIEIYAVNRPMRQDKTNAWIDRIKQKKYSFPVLKSDQETLDKLNIYKYPTVVILNKKGELVLMGEIEEAEKKLASIQP